MRILWVSRHPPQKEQVDELNSIFGSVDIIFYPERISSAKEVADALIEKKADDLVVVLPQSMIADLTSMGITPIKAIMRRELKPYGEVVFHHQGFERIKEVTFTSEKL